MKKWLFRVARGPRMGAVVGHAFRYVSWAIPVKQVGRNEDILAFEHPKPCYDHHLILSPKRAIANLQQMSREPFSPYFGKLWRMAREIVCQQPAYADSFALVANGGRRQEVGQVHFHLFAHHEMVGECGMATDQVYGDASICILRHPNPEWEIHFVMRPSAAAEEEAYFRSVLLGVDWLVEREKVEGYSLVYQPHARPAEGQWPVFHFVAGATLRSAKG